jgi:hypothetical protein
MQEPKTKAELQEARRESLPEALSEKQLQHVSTGRVRYALSQLAQDNVGQLQEWIDQIALVDGPKAAFEIYLKMIEYSIPKLSRTEVKVEDSAGNAAVAQLSMDDLQQMIRTGVALETRTIEGELEE